MTILVISSDPKFCGAVSDFLRMAAGHTVLVARNKNHALGTFEFGDSIDAAILDFDTLPFNIEDFNSLKKAAPNMRLVIQSNGYPQEHMPTVDTRLTIFSKRGETAEIEAWLQVALELQQAVA